MPEDSGKFGAFIGCSQLSRVPLHAAARRVGNGDGEADAADGKLLGNDPETGQPVSLRTGRFGPYVQLGEGARAKSRSAPACPRAGRRRRSTWKRRCGCWRCPARSACTRRPASRSWPASAATARSSCTTAPTPTSTARGSVQRRPQPRGRSARREGSRRQGRFQRAKPTALKDLGDHPDGGGRSRCCRAATALRQARQGQRHAAQGQGPAAMSWPRRSSSSPSAPPRGRRKRRSRSAAAGEGKPAAKGAKRQGRRRQAGQRRQQRSRDGRSRDLSLFNDPARSANKRADPKTPKAVPPNAHGLPGRDEILEFIERPEARPASARSPGFRRHGRRPPGSSAMLARAWPRRACCRASARACASPAACRR